MFILVSGATLAVERLMRRHPNLGVLLTPAAGNYPPPRGTIWAADNSAFSGFDDARFRAMLNRIAGRNDCRFVAAPDVVGNAEATADLWVPWATVIRGHGLTPALVLQDGITLRDMDWSVIKAVFVGGSTRFKIGETAAEIVAEANRRGCWTHMGRVNTARRVLYAAALRVRSIDGSGFSRFADTHLPWALRLARQRPLCWEGR